MDNQYVPEVSDSDVERIVVRDFSEAQREVIWKMIKDTDVREKTRVVLACLKNANGDLKKLQNELTEAPGYYRESIGEAEYPNYMKKGSHIEKLSTDERNQIAERDKEQYLTWLNRPAK